MNIKTAHGTMTLDPDAIASREDRTDIISSLTRDDDNGAEFQALCDASAHFGRTNQTFHDDCSAWLEGFRKFQPITQ